MKPLCCICRPGCAGVDAPAGEISCALECAPCLHGCPASIGDICCLDEPITVLSLWEPWATGVGRVKWAETRTWRPTKKQLAPGSDLIIHAAAARRPLHEVVIDAPHLIDDLDRAGVAAHELPFGCIRSRVRYIDAVRTDDIAVDPDLNRPWTIDDGAVRISRLEARWGNYEPDRWAWLFTNVRHFEHPVAFTGGQGLTKKVSLNEISTTSRRNRGR